MFKLLKNFLLFKYVPFTHEYALCWLVDLFLVYENVNYRFELVDDSQ